MAVRDRDISQPNEVIDSGPYRFSRNPMYVAWTLIYLGAAALMNTLWPLTLLPLLVAFTHYIVVRREEQQLEAQFGEAYRQYRKRVRRCF
jgi:protein-S-isoprenylcysteine O-methyltransferase Ste14